MDWIICVAVEKLNYMSEAEYLEFERHSTIKHEFFNGQIFAMTGASISHNRISSNINGILHRQLRNKDCEAFVSEMRVYVPTTGLYTYPDISIVCGDPLLQDNVFDTLLNPLILIEILSPSTEAYDRGEKFQHYRSIASLREYLLIAQHQAHIDHYRLNDHNQWVLTDKVGLEATLELESISCTLPLAEVYEKVVFPSRESDKTD